MIIVETWRHLSHPEMGVLVKETFETRPNVDGIQFNMRNPAGKFYAHLVARDDAAAQLIEEETSLKSLRDHSGYTDRPVFYSLSATVPDL